MGHRLGFVLVTVLLGLFPVAAGGDESGAAAAGAPELKVALVLDPTWRTSPLERSAYEGLRRAVRDLGVAGRAIVQGPKEPLLPILLSLARQRVDLIMTFPIFDPPALDTVALRFPEMRFLALDMPLQVLGHRPKNVQGTVFRVEEPSYLAGYLAGLMEVRRPGKDVVSSVGGGKFPPVDRFIAGFQAGVRKADPAATAFNEYANDFLDPAKCEQVALAQIARGSGVVFQVAGVCGAGALEAARAHGVFGIGVDGDQSRLGPHVLTSVRKRLDVAVYGAARSLTEGTFRTGANSVFTLANGGVDLGKISPRVPHALVARMNAIRRQILSGRIRGIPTMLP